MKEHPILFSTDMVKAILDGTKTMTRRINGLTELLKYPHPETLEYKGHLLSPYYLKKTYRKDHLSNPKQYHWFLGEQEGEINPIPVKCPYGQVGDRLWVRETCKILEQGGIKYLVQYKTTSNPDERLKDLKWTPSIHMPRWASRINLEITEVRVERLQDITYGGCMAEGLDMSNVDYRPGWDVSKFKAIWDKLNAKRGYGWKVNPWCWCISFKRIDV